MGKSIFFLCCFLPIAIAGFTQEDSSGNQVDSFLIRQKGLIGKLARNLMSNNATIVNAPIRKDLLLMRYDGRIVRNITIRRIEFGTPITDTSRSFKNTFTRIANDLHRETREKVIRNNLFFHRGDKFVANLVADNERHLRDLPYLQDASITAKSIGIDSVDIIVLTKDVLSIGGSYRMHNTTKMSIAVSEDNVGGSGHELLLRNFFDNKRAPKYGYGVEYTARNLHGSFIDWYGGYLTFNKNFVSGAQNEEMFYTGFVRPLVNPYMKFTYAATAAWHDTHDFYKIDSLYASNSSYRYYNYDAWIGWNTGAFKLSSGANRDNRMRTLLGLRYVQQNFSNVPSKYEGQYAYQYADLRAILGAVTVFRQDYYKAQNIYGFGRNEDIPEGADLSMTGGWAKKSGVSRPYIGLDIQRYFFTAHESYFNYTLKADAFIRNKKLEDINLLFNVDYFSRLLRLGNKWKQRNFLTFSMASLKKRNLDEPLFLQSDFGVREWRNDSLDTGDSRITLKAESVFFTPWNFIKFRFAPFIFGNLCLFTPEHEKFKDSKWYNSIGGGIRTRNESLIFETMEFRAYYFPGRNFLGDHWRLEFNTNIRFKYNTQFEKKPDFVNINVK